TAPRPGTSGRAAAWSRPTCTGTWNEGCARCGSSTSPEAIRSAQNPYDPWSCLMTRRGTFSRKRREYRAPTPHPSGARPPKLPGELIPGHVAIVMDGNGRWAKQRGLPRTEGHKRGEEVVLEVVQGCIELGVRH